MVSLHSTEMKIVFVNFVGWAMFLMSLHLGNFFSFIILCMLRKKTTAPNKTGRRKFEIKTYNYFFYLIWNMGFPLEDLFLKQFCLVFCFWNNIIKRSGSWEFFVF